MSRKTINAAQGAAMESIFSLFKAVDDNGLSINDLSEVIEFAVEDGHDMLEIVLAMVLEAVKLVQKRRGVVPVMDREVPE